MTSIADIFSLARRFQQAGNMPHAEFLFRQVVQADPLYADAWRYLGAVCQAQGKLAEAETIFRRIGVASNSLGIVLAQQGKLDESAACFQEVLRAQPADVRALNNLGVVRLNQGRPQDGEVLFRKALEHQPNDADARGNLGAALRALGRLDEAIVQCRQALQLRPNSAGEHYNLGVTLADAAQLSDAVACHRAALRLQPDLIDAYNGLGVALMHQGNSAEALRCFEEVLLRRPSDAQAHFNRAQLWLLSGNWPQGWQEFEWRWQTGEFPRFDFAQPRWNGSPLAGRTILLVAEQGLGDTFQFVRYIPLLQQLGARVRLLSQDVLQGFLTRCLQVPDVVVQRAPLPPFDVYASLLSLPALMGTLPTNIPAPVPYIDADPGLVGSWRKALAAIDGFKVGIAWQGSPAYRGDRLRSIPLKHFAHLVEVPGVKLISLQKGPGIGQLTGLAERGVILDLEDRFDEKSEPFMDSAAILKSLDLVITSDTAVAHLAGALGVPVWVALPAVPDWRWLLGREDSPWYPTMRLFRQTRSGQWEDVFDRIRHCLAAVVAKSIHSEDTAANEDV